MAMSGCVQTVGPVLWDYSFFQRAYPDLARWVSPEMGQSYFMLATLYLDNTDGSCPCYVDGYGYSGSRGGSVVRDIGQRQMLLGLLTAHIAALNAPLNGAASSNSVGRVSSATEGSVSVSFDYPMVAGAEFYGLTKFGAMFWAATARYRMGRYFPAPPQSCGRFGTGPYGWRRGY